MGQAGDKPGVASGDKSGRTKVGRDRSGRDRSASQSKQKGKSQGGGQVRLIAGRWRGRKLSVVDVNGLRPTGDRVRETLFNWLQAHIAGSHCLDLFAGSGALGFEAYSRYAASACLVEPNTTAFRSLEQSLTKLQSYQDSLSLDSADASSKSPASARSGVTLIHSNAQQFLSENTERFDLVFVDPPFDDQLQDQTIIALVPDHLAPGALIYVESPASQPACNEWPDNIYVFRDKVIGDVRAQLLEVSIP